MLDSREPEVVVITGASAGVGRATARAFAARGARVGLVARGHEGLDGARRDVQQEGARALAIPIDVADPDAMEEAADAVERNLGPIDIWVNNAMTSVFAPFHQITPEEFRRVTEVTYLGQVYGTMAALRRMRPRDRGTIVQVGSVLAFRAIPLQSAYSGAKHAVEGFTESLRSELLHDRSGVRLTMVQLPAVNTPQFEWVKSRLPREPQPVPPIYEPEIAADAIVWAAHHDRRQVTVGLHSAMIIQLNKFFPGLGDRYLAKSGYTGQQTEETADPDRPSNLWRPVDESKDFGAHGEFGSRTRRHSPQLWANKHRRLLTLTAGVVGAAGVVTKRLLDGG